MAEETSAEIISSTFDDWTDRLKLQSSNGSIRCRSADEIWQSTPTLVVEHAAGNA
ncbi:hypothetical protein SynNOUM97013_01548 [Synechococcus sp. NOUM97013]|nr:hypothetical protein SynNOUM97013_01548 [Synechococcus sp. NOUM97013]